MKLAAAAQMREMDRQTIEERGIPGLTLMENAGIAVTREVVRLLDASAGRTAAIICGKGNNGGDGLVVARHLQSQGIAVRVVLLARAGDLTGDAATNHQRAVEAGVLIREAGGDDARQAVTEAIEGADVVVDAILGTGATGEVRGAARDAIEAINEARDPAVVAVDIPSGVDSDTGRVLGAAVLADSTVTFAVAKVGLCIYPGAMHSGEVTVADIGIPADVVAGQDLRFELTDPAWVAAVIPSLPPDAHKGDAGRLVVIAGSVGMTGAAALCCQAATRMGAGLVYLCCPESLNDILEVKLTEPITRPMPETGQRSLSSAAAEPILELLKSSDALVLGPGISTHADTQELVKRVVAAATVPTIIDADGLNCLAQTPAILAQMRAPKVLAPHPGELGRLLAIPISEVQDNRLHAALTAAERLNAVVVLKGAGTVVAEPSGRASINSTGNSGMASGGTGDVLAGMIGTLLAQRVPPFDAAVAAVYVHGLAGDIAAERVGERSLIAGDLVDALPEALQRLATEPGIE